jgi:hypothetical protein
VRSCTRAPRGSSPDVIADGPDRGFNPLPLVGDPLVEAGQLAGRLADVLGVLAQRVEDVFAVRRVRAARALEDRELHPHQLRLQLALQLDHLGHRRARLTAAAG